MSMRLPTSHHRAFRPTDAMRVRRFMTASPHTVGCEQTIARAQEVMRSHRIRHLPVLKAGKLVGIVSERDIYFVEALESERTNQLPVEQAMAQDIFSVGPDESVAEVARSMMSQRLGCAVVVEAGKVCGVFTTIDALRALIQFAPQSTS